MMQQMNAIAPTGIASMMRGMPQGQPQKPLSPTAGIGNVADRMRAYGPQGLEQKNAVSEDLLNLIAAQKLKSEKEAALRDMQMKAAQQGQPLTVAESLDQELMQMTKAEMAPQQMAPQVAGASQEQDRQKRMAMQQLMQGIARAPGAQQMPGMAAGGIVAFANGGETQEDRDRKAILAALEQAGMGAAKLAAAGYDVFTMPVRALAGIYNTLARGPRAFGVNLPFIPKEFGQESMTPAMDRLMQREAAAQEPQKALSMEAPEMPVSIAAPQQAAPTAPTAPAAPAMRMPPAQVTSKVPVAPGAGIAQGPAAQVLNPAAMGQGISPSPLEQATEKSATAMMGMRPETEIEAARKRYSQTMDPALQAAQAERRRGLEEIEAFNKPDPERQKREAVYAMLRGYAQPVPGGGGISQFFLNAGAAGNRYQQAQRDMELKNMLERQRRRGEITGADVKSAEELFKSGEATYGPSLQAQAAGTRAGTDLLGTRERAATAAADRASREKITMAQIKAAERRAAEDSGATTDLQRKINLFKQDPETYKSIFGREEKNVAFEALKLQANLLGQQLNSSTIVLNDKEKNAIAQEIAMIKSALAKLSGISSGAAPQGKVDTSNPLLK